MEDKIMKFTKTNIVTSCLFLLFSLSSADEKSVEKDHFLIINPNIKNEELRSELKILMKDFDLNKQNIHDYYTKEIEKLKEERRLKIKTIKKTFGEKRKDLLIKYGEDQKPKHFKPLKSNIPNKKKGKDNKPIRKSK